jgi:hypothetical protein
MQVETQQLWPVLAIGFGVMLIATAWLLPT